MEFQLIIKFDPATNDCKVTGPINESALCLKALQLANNVLDQYYRKTGKNLIKPTIGDIKSILHKAE